ncbi:MAG TPA: carboxypeptidase M32 [Thermoanaerobaculia bacterium]|nr:carboxypeptidase M32 [Thermoanaerobaculia bacterium]
MDHGQPSHPLSEPQERFRRLWRQVRDLEGARQLLEWDQETYMPAGGAPARGRVLGTLAGLEHERLSDPALGEAVEAIAASASPGDEWEAQAREARRRIRRATAVPRRLAEELAEAASAGLAAWQEARRAKDFGGFAAPLSRLLLAKREQAACLASGGAGGALYDALLDEYEPGATVADLVPLFAALRARLVPLVRAVAESGRPVDETPLRGRFPMEAQRQLGTFVAAEIGFDWSSGRLDRSTHPFCTGIASRDVRLTWRGQEEDLRQALMGVLHEMGHGLYDQGLPAEWESTPLGEPASTGVHESQSRLWEILVGRGRPFWRWLLPHVRQAFPGYAPRLEQVWPALHAIKPTLIRVEADEATYNLHVLVRFELERALFGGDLQVADLPAAWDDLYAEVLGLRSPDVAQGVLQDLHWAAGLFGYFPTYTLGTLAAVQLFDAARAQLGDLDAQLAAGEFAPLLGWLRERVHRHGSRYPPRELLTRAAGAAPSAEPFLAYVEGIAEEVYGVAPAAAAASTR